jgi:putative hemolysin
MNDAPLFKIDVEQVLKNKVPNVKIPRFIVNYLKKIAHENDINSLLVHTDTRKNLDFIESSLEYFKITLDIIGRDNLPPKKGRYIFAGNHPLGGFDGVATGYFLGKAYDNKVRLIVNDILMGLPPLRDMFIPVNKTGSQNKEYADMMRTFYESDFQLMTYPAGMCSRKVHGEIADMEWKKNFISKAVEFQRDVVPIYFEGRNSNFFYNLSKCRMFFKIKLNIEMLYLVDELFKQTGKHFRICVGKPISWQTFDKSKTYEQWAQWVKEIVYEMAKE